MTRLPTHRFRRTRAATGSTLAILAAAIIVLAALGLALSMMTHSTSEEGDAATDEMRAHYAAEAAVNEALAVLRDGGRPALTAIGYPQTLRGTTYSVHVTLGDADPALGDDLIRLVGTAQVGGGEGSVELVLRETAGGGVPPGVFGDTVLHLETDSMIDSYDSTAGSYASQAVNTWGTITYAGSTAPTGSNGDVVLKTGSSVFGDGRPGPTSIADISGGSQVTGSTAPAASTLTLPAVTVPSVTSSGDYALDSASDVLGPGDHRYGVFSLSNDAVLTIQGPAVLVVDDAKVETRAQILADVTGGPVVIYATTRWQLKTDALVQPSSGRPKDLALRISAVGQSHKFETGTAFTGTVYAPQSEVVVQTANGIWGSLVAGTITMKTKANVHVDTTLTSAGDGSGGNTLVWSSWRPLSPVQAEAITGP